MQALILAGGEGTRLRPLTSTVPKPVIPLANRPFISYMLDWLIRHGVDDIVMSCGFLASEVRAVLGDGHWDGARLRYVEEDRPLGTAGGVKLAEDLLDERFMVLNGDVLADYDLSALQRFHSDQGARATIALVPVADPSAYGLVRKTSAGEIQSFLEKPRPEEIDTNLINAGAYVLERDVLDLVPAGTPTSFEREVFPKLVGSGLFGFEALGYWLDIGTPERYLVGTYDILDCNLDTVTCAELGDEGIALGSDVELHERATVMRPSAVGAGCEIAAGAQIGPYTVLGDGCRVGAGAVVERAVLHTGAVVEPRAVVRQSVVGKSARVGAESRLDAGTMIGQEGVVGARSVLSGAKVDAGATLPEAAVVEDDAIS